MKYTYLRGKGHEWRVVLPKMTEAEAARLDVLEHTELRRLAWTVESSRKLNKKGASK